MALADRYAQDGLNASKDKQNQRTTSVRTESKTRQKTHVTADKLAIKAEEIAQAIRSGAIDAIRY